MKKVLFTFMGLVTIARGEEVRSLPSSAEEVVVHRYVEGQYLNTEKRRPMPEPKVARYRFEDKRRIPADAPDLRVEEIQLSGASGGYHREDLHRHSVTPPPSFEIHHYYYCPPNWPRYHYVDPYDRYPFWTHGWPGYSYPYGGWYEGGYRYSRPYLWERERFYYRGFFDCW